MHIFIARSAVMGLYFIKRESVLKVKKNLTEMSFKHKDLSEFQKAFFFDAF